MVMSLSCVLRKSAGKSGASNELFRCPMTIKQSEIVANVEISLRFVQNVKANQKNKD